MDYSKLTTEDLQEAYRTSSASSETEAILDALADRLVLAPLRRRLTGGKLRFFISGGAGLAGNRNRGISSRHATDWRSV